MEVGPALEKERILESSQLSEGMLEEQVRERARLPKSPFFGASNL